MNCAEFWNGMPELATGSDSKHEHLKECPQCAGLFERQRRLASGLRLMADDMRAVAAPPRVEANLIDAFRREMTPAGPLASRSRWIPALSWVAAGAAAVALILGIGLVPRRHTSVPAVHHGASTAVELAAVVDDAADDDGFIPLPNVERVDPNDDVQIVQMELQRSAMLEVGLEVSPDRVSEPVQAEVMLGPDGLARAVRFIDTDGTN